jgi:methionine aminotransferase
MSHLAKENDAINLSQGFPNFDPDGRLLDRVSYHMNNSKNQYAPMAGVLTLRQKIAKKIENLYDVSVNPEEEITITAGATQAIFTTITAFVNEGDEVIVVEPAFDCYNPAIELVGGKIVPYRMIAPDFKIDWKKFETLISSRTRMIIINTPHNPTGTVLMDHDLRELDRILDNKEILVISDEVYEHLIFDGLDHCTILKYPRLRSKSIAVFSFGKTFHCTGWKIGYTVMPPNLMKEFRKVHQFNVFSVNSFVQHGISDFLDQEDFYLGLPKFYQEKRDILTNYLEKSRFDVIPSLGTYFILCRFNGISKLPDTEFAKWMTQEHRLACIPISVFYESKLDEHLVRFCFAKTEDVLHEAGKILLEV